MNVTDVKQGDPVVYEINGKAYNGVALGTASLGHHPGLQTTSYHLNLIYLNEQGAAIKIFGAPLLTKATGDAELTAMAEVEARLKPQISFGRRVVDEAATKKQLAETINRTIGWRPAAEGEALKTLKESLAQSQGQVVELKQSAGDALVRAQTAEKAAADAQAEVEKMKAHAGELQGHIDELSKPVQAEVESLKGQLADAQAEIEGLKTKGADGQ